MPATSKSQLRAMFAAKSGASNLGIPKKVGAEFVAATPSDAGLPESAETPTDEPRPRVASAMEAMTGLPSGRRKIRRGGRGKKNRDSNAANPAPVVPSDPNRRDNMTAESQTSKTASTPTVPAPDIAGHLANVNKAMASGAHDQAKSHALSLAKALHKASLSKMLSQG